MATTHKMNRRNFLTSIAAAIGGMALDPEPGPVALATGGIIVLPITYKGSIVAWSPVPITYEVFIES